MSIPDASEEDAGIMKWVIEDLRSCSKRIEIFFLLFFIGVLQRRMEDGGVYSQNVMYVCMYVRSSPYRTSPPESTLYVQTST